MAPLLTINWPQSSTTSCGGGRKNSGSSGNASMARYETVLIVATMIVVFTLSVAYRLWQRQTPAVSARLGEPAVSGHEVTKPTSQQAPRPAPEAAGPAAAVKTAAAAIPTASGTPE